MSRSLHRDYQEQVRLGCPGYVLLLVGSGLGIVLAVGGWGGGSAWMVRAVWVVAGAGLVLTFLAGWRAWRSEARVKVFQQARNEAATRILDSVTRGGAAPEPFFVYLRPFRIDDDLFVDSFRARDEPDLVEKFGMTPQSGLEGELAKLVEGHGVFVALSLKERPAGAGHLRVPNNEWQQDVLDLCEKAAGILLVPIASGGTRWEVALILERGWLDRTLFVMPPTSLLGRWLRSRWRVAKSYSRPWEEARAMYTSSGLELPQYDDRGGVVRIRGGGAEIVGLFTGSQSDAFAGAMKGILEDLALRRA